MRTGPQPWGSSPRKPRCLEPWLHPCSTCRPRSLLPLARTDLGRFLGSLCGVLSGGADCHLSPQISHIGKLRDFLLEHRKDYINAYR